MAEATFYTDAATVVDGYIAHDVAAGATWATIRDGVGVTAVDNLVTIQACYIGSHADTDKWIEIHRGILLFDILTPATIPSNAIILSVIETLYGSSKVDLLGITPDVNIYQSGPASSTALVAGDYNSLGIIPLCNYPIAYADFVVDGSNPVANEFVLNATGLVLVRAAFASDGIVKLGTRNANYDVASVEPTWSSHDASRLEIHSAEKGGLFRPKLVITYAIPTELPPTVTTEECRDVEATSLTGYGDIVSLGDAAVTQHGHCWATTPYPTTADDKTTNGAAPHTGHFTSAVTGLTPDTNYFLRAYATNSYGTGYGENVESQPGFFTGKRDLYIYKKTLRYYDRYGTLRILEGRAAGALDV